MDRSCSELVGLRMGSDGDSPTRIILSDHEFWGKTRAEPDIGAMLFEALTRLVERPRARDSRHYAGNPAIWEQRWVADPLGRGSACTSVRPER